MSEHHLPDELLLSYAAGTLTPAMSLLVATHASLCAKCQENVRLGETLGGSLLHEQAVDFDTGALLDEVMTKLHHNTQAETTSATAPPSVLPLPVRQALGDEQISWRFLSPRIRYTDLPVATEYCPVRLFRLAPNVVVPVHGHKGEEFTVVLSGGLIERGKATYRRGDVLIGSTGEIHRLTTEASEACVSLVVQTDALRPKTISGWLAKRIVGM